MWWIRHRSSCVVHLVYILFLLPTQEKTLKRLQLHDCITCTGLITGPNYTLITVTWRAYIIKNPLNHGCNGNINVLQLSYDVIILIYIRTERFCLTIVVGRHGWLSKILANQQYGPRSKFCRSIGYLGLGCILNERNMFIK